ncbi:translation initiation factor IF-2-like [Tympanuchus pallidicinctus]|uniref:translation initiation factor IF-2-like n=1 Tax=Tympanuchus pallidicinctus TaxID=109042 RepID=UPI0022870459|nr:translation initiation factor IF-2-like [Tympanuchus pallidicinctus]
MSEHSPLPRSEETAPICSLCSPLLPPILPAVCPQPAAPAPEGSQAVEGCKKVGAAAGPGLFCDGSTCGVGPVNRRLQNLQRSALFRLGRTPKPFQIFASRISSRHGQAPKQVSPRPSAHLPPGGPRLGPQGRCGRHRARHLHLAARGSPPGHRAVPARNGRMLLGVEPGRGFSGPGRPEKRGGLETSGKQPESNRLPQPFPYSPHKRALKAPAPLRGRKRPGAARPLRSVAGAPLAPCPGSRTPHPGPAGEITPRPAAQRSHPGLGAVQNAQPAAPGAAAVLPGYRPTQPGPSHSLPSNSVRSKSRAGRKMAERL